MANYIEKNDSYGPILYLAIILSVLYLTSFYSYLLFHSLSEIASVAIAFGIFAVIWNSRKYINNGYFLVVGIAYLFIGAMDTLHMLSYENMGIFKGGGANLPTQLWLASRALTAFSFLIAPFFLERKTSMKTIALFYAVLSSALMLSIFYWHIFPDAFITGSGLTSFKKISEYAISLIFFLALFFLWRKKNFFDERVVRMLSVALALMIGSELIFTLYRTVTDGLNLLGHQLKIASAYFAYIALIEMGLLRPYRMMFEDLKEKERSLRESEERYRHLAELSPDAIVLHENGTIVYANSSAVRILGAGKPEDLLGKNMKGFVHGGYKDKIKGRMKALYANKIERVPLQEVQFVRLDGSIVDVEVSGSLVEYGEKKVIQSIIRDITERKNSQRKIEYLGSHDFLTGLYNRFHFERMIGRFLERKISPVSVVVVDLDGLKNINDKLGHQAGDKLIQSAASVLTETFRKNDIVARIGGDEFAILLPEIGEKEVGMLIERLMENVQKENHSSGELKLEFSYGVETAHRSEEIAQSFRTADESMYKQKQKKKLGRRG